MSEAFLRMLPEAVVVVAADPDEVDDDLFPEERVLIERAVEKRRREFAAGRRCARRAMASLGVEPAVLVNDDDRSPIWPAGLVGSIAHTRGYCVVAVARTSEVEAVGVDVEPDDDVKPELWDRICTDEERRWLAAQPDATRGRLVRLVFSAKEAFYKCQYPVTRQFLGFHDVRLELDTAGTRFEIELLREAGRFGVGERFEGRFDRTGGWIRTAMAWSR